MKEIENVRDSVLLILPALCAKQEVEVGKHLDYLILLLDRRQGPSSVVIDIATKLTSCVQASFLVRFTHVLSWPMPNLSSNEQPGDII